MMAAPSPQNIADILRELVADAGSIDAVAINIMNGHTQDAPAAAEAPDGGDVELGAGVGAAAPLGAAGEPPKVGAPEERHDDDDLSKLSKGAKKVLRRAIASMKLGKSDPLKILQAVRAGVVALMKFDLEPGFNAAIAHLRDVARDLYELPVKDIQPQIDGGIQEVLEQRAVGDDSGGARKGRAPPDGKGDRVDDDQ